MSTLENRRARAAELIDRAGLGAVSFVPGPNFAYLTGVHLHLMERPTLFVLTRTGGMAALMPRLEREKWGCAMPDAETFYWDDAEGPVGAFAGLARAIGTDAPLGVEGLRMRAAEYLHLGRHWPQGAVQDADPALTDLRLTKDATEVAELRQAIEISEIALHETLEAGIGGRTEAEIAARLKAAMLAHGASGFAFEPIVLTGGAAANPHGDAGHRTVLPGQCLLIDFGASLGDMNADITRTVFCEHASDAHANIYHTVLAANEAGRAAVQPGVAVGQVDAAATDVLSNSDHAHLILHKTGHGLGREVHEAPQVMRSNTDPMRPGMVFTIEPGLYQPGEIGVRIEDNVLVTEDGHDCLTHFPRDLRTYA